jgi:hypothetical protein
MYNMSLQENTFMQAFSKPFAKDNNLLSLKVSLDNAVLEVKAREKGWDVIPEIEVDYQAYPYVPDRLYQGADPVVNVGSFYLVLVPLTVFMIIFEEMSREKAYNQRMGLILIGCSNTAYWLSWVITGIVLSAVMAVLMHACGTAFGFSVFLNTPLLVIFLLIFSVSVLDLAIAFFLITVISN